MGNKMKTSRLLLATAVLGLLTFTASAQSWLTNGLVAYYPFNGNANDASGNGHNASTNGGATLTADRFGNTNSAYHFQNALLNYTNIPVNLAGPYSFSIWMKLDSYDVSAIGELNDPNYDCNANPQIYENNQTVTYAHCGYGPGSGSSIALLFSGVGSLTNAWHQLFVSVAAGGQTMVFRDGVLMTNTPESLWPTTTKINLTLGASGNTASPMDFSRVNLDDVRIYNRAFSTNEVAQLYVLESAPIISVQKAVYLTSNNLWTGTNYQLQSTTDLINWTNQGSVFTATNSSWRSTNYWDVANWNQLFFRLQQQ
jgi:hypothetical protein